MSRIQSVNQIKVLALNELLLGDSLYENANGVTHSFMASCCAIFTHCSL